MPPVSLIVSRGGAEPSDADGGDGDAITADLLLCKRARNESSAGAVWEWKGVCWFGPADVARREGKSR